MFGSLDMRTIITGFIVTNFVGTMVILLLHLDDSKRYQGTFLWVINYSFQTAALILIALRGQIPDWISMDVSNTLSVGGMVLGFKGLGQFMGIEIRQLHNYIILAVFAAVHFWLTVITPDLSLRNLNLAVASGTIFFQYYIFLIFRVPAENKRFTRMTGILFLVFFLISLVRILKFFLTTNDSNNFFQHDPLESVVMIAYQVNILLLAYSIVLMYNKRALMDISINEEKYSKAFMTSPSGIILSTMEDGKIVEINQGFSEITGFSSSEALGNSTVDLIWLNRDQRSELILEVRKSGRVYAREILLRKKGGERLHALYSSSMIDINGVKHVLTNINDITNRKLAEEELNRLNNDLESRVYERTQQLEASNTELEAFSYSVSHDLRAPLRAIHGFSQVFSEEYGSTLDDEGKRICSIIESSAVRMGDLIDNLLAFSRVGRVELNMTNINMYQMVVGIVSDLTSASQNNVPEVILKDMPDTYGDPGSIRIVLTNLITNALKYSSKVSEPVIEIGSVNEENKIIYYVKDNGAGFDMKYYGKLFRVFQRLHNAKEFDGTGVGLAIVDRIIKRHNGEVWAESERGVGSVFYFTLHSADKVAQNEREFKKN